MRYMNICRVCGHYFSDGVHLCPNCNNPAGSVFCYKCGSIINQRDNFCPICGDNRREHPFSPHERGAKRNPFGPLGVAPDGVDAIDLGLSYRWASCNVGANRPEERGYMYAWGETKERTSCDWSNYSRCGGSKETCYDLGSLNLCDFNTSEVVYMSDMFERCSSIETIDLSSFTTNDGQDMDGMFSGCTNLKTIYVNPSWKTPIPDNWESGMFKGCINLKGGNGTAYNHNENDYLFAHIDQVDNPGYFTEKEKSSEEQCRTRNNK